MPEAPQSPELDLPRMPEAPQSPELDLPRMPESSQKPEFDLPRMPEAPQKREFDLWRIPEAPQKREFDLWRIPEAPQEPDLDLPQMPEAEVDLQVMPEPELHLLSKSRCDIATGLGKFEMIRHRRDNLPRKVSDAETMAHLPSAFGPYNLVRLQNGLSGIIIEVGETFVVRTPEGDFVVPESDIAERLATDHNQYDRRQVRICVGDDVLHQGHLCPVLAQLPEWIFVMKNRRVVCAKAIDVQAPPSQRPNPSLLHSTLHRLGKNRDGSTRVLDELFTVTEVSSRGFVRAVSESGLDEKFKFAEWGKSWAFTEDKPKRE
jgi:hypothetical protein